jgi:hypothetical protein
VGEAAEEEKQKEDENEEEEEEGKVESEMDEYVQAAGARERHAKSYKACTWRRSQVIPAVA